MNKFVIKILTVFFIFSSLFTNSYAVQNPSPKEVQQAVTAQIKQLGKWAKDPAIIKAVEEQNSKHVPLSEIQAIDKEWIANKEVSEFMQTIMANASSKRLKVLAKSDLYAEAFVMDDQGANVAMTRKTSDYWQGDEAKWKKAFNEGKGATFVDKPQYDKSTDSILIQVSLPVKDPKGAVIGTMTVGLNLDKLKSKIK